LIAARTGDGYVVNAAQDEPAGFHWGIDIRRASGRWILWMALCREGAAAELAYNRFAQWRMAPP
jgi:hypothetical protein